MFHDAATGFGDASRVRRDQQLWGADIVHLGRHQQCALDLRCAAGYQWKFDLHRPSHRQRNGQWHGDLYRGRESLRRLSIWNDHRHLAAQPDVYRYRERFACQSDAFTSEPECAASRNQRASQRDHGRSVQLVGVFRRGIHSHQHGDNWHGKRRPWVHASMPIRERRETETSTWARSSSRWRKRA